MSDAGRLAAFAVVLALALLAGLGLGAAVGPLRAEQRTPPLPAPSAAAAVLAGGTEAQL